MTRVLMVGTDCSECSERAVAYAAEWAAATGSPLIVAHVIEWSPFSFNTPQENEERHKRREAELERAHREVVDPVVEGLRERGMALLRQGREKAQEIQEKAVAKSKAAARVTDDYVHENPWRSIGVAFGVGIAVGLLINRAR